MGAPASVLVCLCGLGLRMVAEVVFGFVLFAVAQCVTPNGREVRRSLVEVVVVIMIVEEAE